MNLPRLHTALAATLAPSNPHLAHITRLQARLVKLETLLREAVIYVEPGTNDGEDLRSRIYQQIPRKS